MKYNLTCIKLNTFFGFFETNNSINKDYNNIDELNKDIKKYSKLGYYCYCKEYK